MTTTPEAVIDNSGVITQTNIYWQDIFLASPEESPYIYGNTGDNYFRYLTKLSENHDSFAVKIIEGIESLYEEEADIFEISLLDPDGQYDGVLRLNLRQDDSKNNDSTLIVKHLL